MYFALGQEPILKNLLLLAMQRTPAESCNSLAKLRDSYHAFLSTKQPRITFDVPEISFISDTKLSAQLMSYYTYGDEGVPVIEPSPDSAAAEVSLGQVRDGLTKLQTKDPVLASLIAAIVNIVFYHPAAHRGGGSTPKAFGVIWCNPSPQWTASDYVEFLVHEFTHQVLFLDEQVHTHFTDRSTLSNTETFVPSSIRRSKRRLDLSLHSLMVATEIVLLRSRLGFENNPRHLHPATGSLLSTSINTATAILDVDRSHQLLTKRSRFLTESCLKTLESERSQHDVTIS
jgi:hypothetical protein